MIANEEGLNGNMGESEVITDLTYLVGLIRNELKSHHLRQVMSMVDDHSTESVCTAWLAAKYLLPWLSIYANTNQLGVT